MEQTATVGQRFNELIAHLGISKNAFANSLDKTATVIQHIVDERNKPGFDLLCKVFDVYPNVSKDWLLQGQGAMLTTAPQPGDASSVAVAAAPPAVVPEKPEPEIASLPASSENVSLAAVVPVAVPPAAKEAMPAVSHTEMPLSSGPVPPAAADNKAVDNQPVVLASTPAPTATATLAAFGQESLQAALYAQQMAHQLTVAEMRNQHLLEQQRLMQQMLDLVQRQLAK
ncbi:helix-turn-helix transcriptional regulator [Hymenobacter daecheongensis]|nr:helix-turn-helix transcriptional regulator [Hymenobacter daecheongensis]